MCFNLNDAAAFTSGCLNTFAYLSSTATLGAISEESAEIFSDVCIALAVPQILYSLYKEIYMNENTLAYRFLDLTSNALMGAFGAVVGLILTRVTTISTALANSNQHSHNHLRGA
jgi:hypothetical protein